MANGQYSRLHIKKLLPDGVEINCFGDNPEEVIAMVCQTVGLAEGDLPEQGPSKEAHVARISHEAQAAAGNPPAGAAPPACPGCGSADDVQLISFKDSGSGKQLSRFKCKTCNKWVGNKV